MKVFKFISIITCFLFLSACEDFFETTLELDPPPFESQLVLSATFSSDEENREVALTRTVALSDDPNDEDAYVNDADIELTYPDGNVYTFENYTPSSPLITYNYNSFCPKFTELGTYKIKATTGRGEQVSAQADLLPLVEITSTSFDEDAGIDGRGREVSAIDITIRHNEDFDDYFSLSLYGKNENSIGSIKIRSIDPSTERSSNNLSLIGSDLSFEEGEHRLRFTFRRDEAIEAESFILYYAAISYDQYRFDKILETAEDNEDNPFTTPVQLHTNIEGGLGIFALENILPVIIEK